MNFNRLMWIGFILRILYAVVNDNYPFSFGSAKGVINIRKKFVSALMIAVIYYLSFFYHASEVYTDGWQLIVMWGVFITIGWAIDSVWIAFTTFLEQQILRKFDASTSKTN